MGNKIKELRNQLIDTAKAAKEKYLTEGDIKEAHVSINASREAIRSAVTQIKYQELQGIPTKIDFLEE